MNGDDVYVQHKKIYWNVINFTNKYRGVLKSIVGKYYKTKGSYEPDFEKLSSENGLDPEILKSYSMIALRGSSKKNSEKFIKSLKILPVKTSSRWKALEKIYQNNFESVTIDLDEPMKMSSILTNSRDKKRTIEIASIVEVDNEDDVVVFDPSIEKVIKFELTKDLGSTTDEINSKIFKLLDPSDVKYWNPSKVQKDITDSSIIYKFKFMNKDIPKAEHLAKKVIVPILKENIKSKSKKKYTNNKKKKKTKRHSKKKE